MVYFFAVHILAQVEVGLRPDSPPREDKQLRVGVAAGHSLGVVVGHSLGVGDRMPRAPSEVAFHPPRRRRTEAAPTYLKICIAMENHQIWKLNKCYFSRELKKLGFV